MSRVLAHFVPREMALLIAFELFLSSALVYVIIGTPAGSGVLTGGLSPLSLGGGALGAVSALIIGVLAATIGLYRPEICLNPVRVLVITTTAAVIAAPLLLLFGAAGQAHRFDDIVLWLGEILGLWFAVLMATRITYSKLIKDHVTMRRVLVVGTEEAAAPLMALLKQRHGHQFNVMRSAAGPETLSLDTIARSGVWGVVLTDGCMDQSAADSLLDMKMRGVRVFDAVRFQENYLGRIDLASINMEWLIKADGFSSSRAAAVFKRVFDITTSVLLLVSTLPVMVITAMLVKLDSPGPVFYRQQRAGYAGAPFTLFKFRSMSVDAEAGGNGGFDHTFARITDAGTAGVRDERDFLAAPETLDDFFAAPRLVELKIAQERFADAKVFEELAAVARVLGGDDIALAQDAQRAKRDVFEIANWRGHEVKRAGSERRQSGVHGLT